jgi:phage shock protein B
MMQGIQGLLRVLLAVLAAIILAAVVLTALMIFLPVFIGRPVGPDLAPIVNGPLRNVHFRVPGVFEIGCLGILAFPFLFVALFLLLGALRAHGGGKGNGGGRLSADEVETLQELHRGFERLSERVEALETILLGHSGKE